MRIARLNETVSLFVQLDREDINQYPQGIIINSAGTIIGTVNLSSVSGVPGKYLGTYVFTSLDDYSIKYIVYSDSARTIINNAYRLSDETIKVSNLEQNVEDILDGNLGQPIAIFD